MLTTKLVVRILNAAGQMLGWAEAEGEARGDGKITVVSPTMVPVDVSGLPYLISVHWCDVNVEIRMPLEAVVHPVTAGSVFTIPGEWAAITCGPPAGGLPPVTVREPILIGMLPGSLGAKVH